MKKRIAAVGSILAVLACPAAAFVTFGAADPSDAQIVQEGSSAGEDEKSADSKEADKLVGVFLSGKASDIHCASIARRIGMKLDENGYLSEAYYAEEDQTLQNEQIREFLEKEADVPALIVKTPDPFGASDVFSEIDLPLFSFDRLMMDTASVSWYISFDYLKAGKLLAETLVERIGLEQLRSEADFRTIEFLMGSPDDVSALFFYNGMMQVLEPYLTDGTLKCLSGRLSFEETAVTNEQEDLGMDMLEEILYEHYRTDQPDILISFRENLAIAACALLREEGRKPDPEAKTYIVSTATDAPAIKAVAEGELGFCVFLDDFSLGEICAETVCKILEDEKLEDYDYTHYDNGKKLIRTVTCEGELIDIHNYQMLVDRGCFRESDVAPEREVMESVIPFPSVVLTQDGGMGFAHGL